MTGAKLIFAFLGVLALFYLLAFIYALLWMIPYAGLIFTASFFAAIAWLIMKGIKALWQKD